MRPLILVTNDDGVLSPGLAAAVGALRSLGDLLIAAPRFQQSGMGRSFPGAEDAGVVETLSVRSCGGEVKAYGVHGSPAQAVAHAVLELAPRRPDLCVSGVNYGENLGLSLTCSGTLGATFEAWSHGVPSLALSQAVDPFLLRRPSYAEIDWAAAVELTASLAARILSRGLGPRVSVLNVNLPIGASRDTPLRVTRQSRLSHSVFVRPGRRDFGSACSLSSALYPEMQEAEPDSDIRAVLLDGVVSVTPVGWDLTAPLEEAWLFNRA